MNIRQLQFFSSAARTGSFSEAARAEGVTVQAVSKSIHDLEDELGGALFTRAGKGMRLTPFGETLEGPARDAIMSFETVERTVEAWNRATTTRDDLRIVLVTPPFAKHELICGIIARLLTHALGVSTNLSVAIGSDALPKLKAGAVDALFTIGKLSVPQCTCTQIGTVTPGVFMGRRHPLRHVKALTFEDLKPYPVLYSPLIDGFNETILATCRKHGLASPATTINSDDQVVDFLENKNGFILGVNLKALSIKPFAIVHELDAADAPPIPVCLNVLEGTRRKEVDVLYRFVCDEFSLMKKLLNTEGSIEGY